MSGTALLDALPALVAVFQGAGVASLEVSDGPLIDPKQNFLAVGWNGDGEAGVSTTRDLSDYGMAKSSETHEVACLLSFHKGKPTAADARAAAMAAFGLLEAALLEDPSLGGTVLLSQITALDVLPSIDEGGCTVDVPFTVQLKAMR